MVPPVRYAYRSFDRHYCLPDTRLGDFLRPVLWRIMSGSQLFMTSLPTGLLGEGPAATMTNRVPDLHHFRGSYGAKDVIALYRDPAGVEPNITQGLLEDVSARLGEQIAPEGMFAYCYALLQAPSYSRRFHEELEVPGPRIPLTSDAALFQQAVVQGRELVWLHTYGERFMPAGHRAGRVPQGAARYVTPIPRDEFPETHTYDQARGELHVGKGIFAPVSPEVRAFSVSGLEVVGSWLDYRMKNGAGRRSSPLDEIRPTTWPEAFTTELLELLWVLERTVALGPTLDELLNAVVASDVILASELPEPTDEERKPPA